MLCVGTLDGRSSAPLERPFAAKALFVGCEDFKRRFSLMPQPHGWKKKEKHIFLKKLQNCDLI
jgi:hypothetical protein